MQIISRAQAISLGLKRYFTGQPCKNGHIAECQVVNYTCCECAKNKKRAKYEANREECLEKLRQYRAQRPEQTKEINRRSRERNRESIAAGKKRWYAKVSGSVEWKEKRAQVRADSKLKKQAYDRRYRELNRERVVTNARNWVKNNPERRREIGFAYDSRRRAQKRKGDSTAVIAAWRKAAAKVCYWCGVPCKRKYHVDHYVPLSKGGLHVTSNLVISCPSCNLKKSAKDPYEFASSLGRLF